MFEKKPLKGINLKKARALAIHLGFDPVPREVSKISQSYEHKDVFTVNNRNFLILTNNEILFELEARLLKNPKILPAEFLALFLTGAFPPDIDFKIIIEIAQSLKETPNLMSIWVIRKLIEYDKFLNEHIREVVDQVGVESFFNFEMVSQIEFQQINFTIIEAVDINSYLEFNPLKARVPAACQSRISDILAKGEK